MPCVPPVLLTRSPRPAARSYCSRRPAKPDRLRGVTSVGRVREPAILGRLLQSPGRHHIRHLLPRRAETCSIRPGTRDWGRAVSNYIVVSSDSHAGARWADYRPYVGSDRLDDFDRWLEAMMSQE